MPDTNTTLERIKRERDERSKGNERTPVHLQRGSRETDGSLEADNGGDKEHDGADEGRDQADTGGQGILRGAGVDGGQADLGTNESYGGPGETASRNAGQTPADAPVKKKAPEKPKGLKTKASKREETERDGEKRETQSERMKRWWAEKKAAQAGQAPAGEDNSATPSKVPVRAPGSRVFSQAEMEDSRDELVETLMDYSTYLDQALRGISRTKAECHVWEMDREEAEPIADSLLKQARKSAKAAERVRNLIDSRSYFKTAAVIVPRMINTVGYIGENGIGLLPTLPGRKGRLREVR